MRRARVGLDINILGGRCLSFDTVNLAIITLFYSYAFKLFGVAVVTLVVSRHGSLPCRAPPHRLWVPVAEALGLGAERGVCGIRSCGRDHESPLVRFSSVRSGFMATTMLLVSYVTRRWALFTDEDPGTKHGIPVSEESH